MLKTKELTSIKKLNPRILKSMYSYIVKNNVKYTGTDSLTYLMFCVFKYDKTIKTPTNTPVISLIINICRENR